MSVKDLLDAGHLKEAIDGLNAEVKAKPTDLQRRTFLFELLCFAGDFERAERQLAALAQASADAELGVQVYRNVLKAERARRRLFADGLRPAFLVDPPAWVELHLSAINRLREMRPAEAKALIEEAAAAWPELAGNAGGAAFTDFRDADDVLAPFLEVILQDRYVWIPLVQLRRLEISVPQRLRDLLWIPATLQMGAGAALQAVVPVLYPGSYEHAEESVKLGRATEWVGADDGPVRGAGQRIFFADDREQPVLQLRQVEFESSGQL